MQQRRLAPTRHHAARRRDIPCNSCISIPASRAGIRPAANWARQWPPAGSATSQPRNRPPRPRRQDLPLHRRWPAGPGRWQAGDRGGDLWRTASGRDRSCPLRAPGVRIPRHRRHRIRQCGRPVGFAGTPITVDLRRACADRRGLGTRRLSKLRVPHPSPTLERNGPTWRARFFMLEASLSQAMRSRPPM